MNKEELIELWRAMRLSNQEQADILCYAVYRGLLDPRSVIVRALEDAQDRELQALRCDVCQHRTKLKHLSITHTQQGAEYTVHVCRHCEEWYRSYPWYVVVDNAPRELAVGQP